MKTKTMTFEVPVFDRYEFVDIRHPVANGEDFILAGSKMFERVIMFDPNTHPDAAVVQLIYRQVPKPAPEVVCGRCGWECGTKSLVVRQIEFTGGSWQHLCCPTCGSNRWDFPDKREAE